MYIIHNIQHDQDIQISREMKKKGKKSDVSPELARSSQVGTYNHILLDVNLPYRSGRPAAPTSSSCWVVGVVGGRECIYNIIIIYAPSVYYIKRNKHKKNEPSSVVAVYAVVF